MQHYLYVFGFGILFLWAQGLACGEDKALLERFIALPTELQVIIVDTMVCRDAAKHTLTHGELEDQVPSYAGHNIYMNSNLKPIDFFGNKTILPKDSGNSGDFVQMFSLEFSKVHFYINNNSFLTYSLGADFRRSRRPFFDGTNDSGYALFVRSDYRKEKRKNGTGEELYIWNAQSKKLSLLMQNYFEDENLITSALLHPEKNRICYARTCITRDLIKSCQTSEHVYKSSFHILDFKDNNDSFVKAEIATGYCGTHLKETVYLGKNIYLAIKARPSSGLMSIWLNEKNEISYADQTILGYLGNGEKNDVRQSLQISHLAVDDEYVTESGFRPRIALGTYETINKKLFFKVFIVDLTLFEKPVLMLSNKIEIKARFLMAGQESLYYNKGKVAVWVCDDSTNAVTQTLTSWPDNLGPLYFKTVLAQK